jgi:hypothetical protein
MKKVILIACLVLSTLGTFAINPVPITKLIPYNKENIVSSGKVNTSEKNIKERNEKRTRKQVVIREERRHREHWGGRYYFIGGGTVLLIIILILLLY